MSAFGFLQSCMLFFIRMRVAARTTHVVVDQLLSQIQFKQPVEPCFFVFIMNSEISQSVSLEGGTFYKLTVLHYNDYGSTDYATLGVTLPSGVRLDPIAKKYLWLQVPGKF